MAVGGFAVAEGLGNGVTAITEPNSVEVPAGVLVRAVPEGDADGAGVFEPVAEGEAGGVRVGAGVGSKSSSLLANGTVEV